MGMSATHPRPGRGNVCTSVNPCALIARARFADVRVGCALDDPRHPAESRANAMVPTRKTVLIEPSVPPTFGTLNAPRQAILAVERP